MKRLISLTLALFMFMSIAPLSLAVPVKDEYLNPVMNGEGADFDFVNDEAFPWEVVDVDGLNYAKSTTAGLGSSSTSITTVASLTVGSVISFDYIVSSEAGYDVMKFGYMEGETQHMLFEDSGEKTDTFSYVITESAEYTFYWSYTKDASMNRNDDCAYVRNVTVTSAPAPEAINIVEENVELVPGFTATLTLAFTPENAFADVVWTSSNNEIATVENGVVTAIAAGNATITATCGNVSDTVTVNVVNTDGARYVEGFRVWGDESIPFGRIRNYMFGDGSNLVVSLPCDLELDELTAAEYYDGVLYVVYNEYLYAVDYETGESQSIGYCAEIYDMTYDYATGRMLGFTEDEYSYIQSIVEINLETGAATPVTAMYTTNLITIAADPDGYIYGIIASTGELARIDLATGEPEIQLETGIAAQYRQSMTFDRTTGILYWAANAPSNEGIYAINVAEGTITPVYEDLGEVVGLHMPSQATAHVPVTGISVDPSEVTVGLGESVTLNATVLPENASNRRVTWATSNEDIAKVNSNGVVTPVGKGTATISATTAEGSFRAECRVTVMGEHIFIEDFEDALEGWTIIDADGDGHTWMSMYEFSQGGLAAYEGLDMMTSQSYLNGDPYEGEEGTVLDPDNWLISPEVTISEFAQSAALTWIAGSQDPEWVDHYSVYVGVGEPVPENFTTVLFSGTAPATATDVSASLTAYAGQTVRFAFRHHDSSDRFYVNIDYIRVSQWLQDNIPVSGVELDRTEATIGVGDILTLTANVLPVEATNKNLTWTTSDAAVATVAEGVVVARGEGTATITVTTEDGGFTASCVVTVVPGVDVTGITLDMESAVMAVGGELTLTATIMPENATNKNIVWTSSDESVATVVNGVVTAIAAGEVTITATTENGGFTATCTIKVCGMGDVTGDGMFNTGDAVAMLRAIAGLDNSNYIAELQDYNGDGQFNTGDAVAVLRKIAGLA